MGPDEQESPDEDEPSASRGRRERDLRLRQILDYIKEKSRVSFREIVVYLNKKRKKPLLKRVLQYDLSTLRLLDAIELGDGKYSPKVTVRKFTEGDHRLALRHSKKLLRPWKKSYEKSSGNRYFWLDLFVLNHLEAEFPESSDEMCLLQHLKSGYFEDFYMNMLEYWKMMEETGLSGINLLPILGHSSNLHEIKKRLEGQSLFPLMENHENAPALNVDDKTLQKIADIRELLIDKLMSIEHSIDNETPLKSRCDYCPHLEISIIEYRASSDLWAGMG